MLRAVKGRTIAAAGIELGVEDVNTFIIGNNLHVAGSRSVGISEVGAISETNTTNRKF